MASRPVIARLDTKKLKPHVENYDAVRKRQPIKKQMSKVTHHKADKAPNDFEDDFDEDEFFFMRTYGENSFTAVKQAHRRTKKLIEHFGREDPTWLENVDVVYRPNEKDFSLKLQDNVLEDISQSIDQMKFQFDDDNSNDFIDKNRIIDPRELLLETQRLRAKDQAKIQAMHERFRTAWTRQELRLKEKIVDMKEDAGVGRLSDRLSEREFQLSRLQREIIQKKEFLDIVVRSDVMSTAEQIREELEKSAMEDIQLLQNTIVSQKSELEGKLAQDKEVAQRIYSLKTLIANEAMKWKLDATRDFEGAKTLTTLKNNEEATRAAFTQLTANLSNAIADMTLILDQVLSQSLKLDGRTTEARVMNSSSTEYQEITTLKTTAARLQREIMEEKSKIKALEDEMTAAGYSTIIRNSSVMSRDSKSSSSQVGTPVNVSIELTPVPTPVPQNLECEEISDSVKPVNDIPAAPESADDIPEESGPCITTGTRPSAPNDVLRANDPNPASTPTASTILPVPSPVSSTSNQGAETPALPMPTPPTSARSQISIHRKPTSKPNSATSSSKSTSRQSSRNNSSKGSKRSTAMRPKAATVVSKPATPIVSPTPAPEEAYAPSEAVESLLPIFAPFLNLPPSTPLIPVETIGSYTSAADNIPASQKLMRDIEITSKLIHRDRLASKRQSILGADEDYEGYGLDKLVKQLETILELISAPEKPPKENPSDVASDEEDKEKLDASSVSSSSSSSSSEESSSDEEDVYLPQDKLGKDIKKLRSKLSVAETDNQKLEEAVEKIQQKVDIVTFKRNNNYKTIMKIIHGDPNKGRQPTLFASEVELGVTRARLNQAKKEEAKWKKKAEQKKIQFDKWLLSRSVNATIAENALAEASSATVPSRSSSIVISLPHARDMCDSDMDSDDESESSDRSEKRISSEALERCDINERILKPSEMLSQSIAESSELSRVTELESNSEAKPTTSASAATVPSREKSFINSVSLSEVLEKIVGSVTQPPPRDREESFSRQLLALSQSPNLELFQSSIVGKKVKPKSKIVPNRVSVVTIGDEVQPVALPPDVQQLIQVPQQQTVPKSSTDVAPTHRETFDASKYLSTLPSFDVSYVAPQPQAYVYKPWKNVLSTLEGAIGAAVPLRPPEVYAHDIITDAERRVYPEFDDSRPVTTTPSIRTPQVPSSAPPASRRLPAMRIDVGSELTATPPKHHRALPPQPLRHHRRIVKPDSTSVTESDLIVTPQPVQPPAAVVAEPAQLLSQELNRMLSRITDDSNPSSLDVEQDDEKSLLHIVALENELLSEAPLQRVGFKPRKLSIHHKAPRVSTSPHRKSHYEPLSFDSDEVVRYRYLTGYASDDDCSYLGVSGALWDRVMSVDPAFIKRLLINQVKQATSAAAQYANLEEDEDEDLLHVPALSPAVPTEAPSSPLPTLFEEESRDDETTAPRTTIQREQSSRSGMLVDFLRAPSPERLKPELVTRNIVYNTLPKRSK